MVDTVSQQIYPICDCCTPKFTNAAPGSCELNKFDDMIMFLAENVTSGLVQVVVVDEVFNVFSRAWCVAEIVEGSALNIPQHIVMHSIGSLEIYYNSVAFLDVRACK